MPGNKNTWKGATCIVTGAGSGIGRALSLALARRGARVTVTDIPIKVAQSVTGSTVS